MHGEPRWGQVRPEVKGGKGRRQGDTGGHEAWCSLKNHGQMHPGTVSHSAVASAMPCLTMKARDQREVGVRPSVVALPRPQHGPIFLGAILVAM